MRSIDPFSEVGTTGLRQFGGYVLEEWLAQLAGRKAAWAYREMLDNDPVIGAIMFAITGMMRKVEWRGPCVPQETLIALHLPLEVFAPVDTAVP
jgi:hypothetical protein